MKIITISGISGSGKTKLAYDLQNYYKNSEIISLDNYSFSEKYLEKKYNEVDFSNPSAFNKKLFLEHINLLNINKEVEVPQIDMQNFHTLTKNKMYKPEILIVEGMFAQSFSHSLNTLDIYVDVDLDIALIRKICRDTKERNRTIEFILDEHINYTKKNIKFITQQKNKTLFIYNSNTNNNLQFQKLIDLIDAK